MPQTHKLQMPSATALVAGDVPDKRKSRERTPAQKAGAKKGAATRRANAAKESRNNVLHQQIWTDSRKLEARQKYAASLADGKARTVSCWLNLCPEDDPSLDHIRAALVEVRADAAVAAEQVTHNGLMLLWITGDESLEEAPELTPLLLRLNILETTPLLLSEIESLLENFFMEGTER